jgi:multicomponent Na+:H+ antiporter subunit A
MGRLRMPLRFYGTLGAFTLAMLGVVTADHLLVMFVFWEITTLTSYVLIGWDFASSESRFNARQALLVTGAGGLSLLAALLLMGITTGTWTLSALLNNPDALRENPAYPWILFLVLGGAFTKSAQFPFHFWLPNAMAAPTPISAFLHSATMVKAGIYLLARLQPVLGGTPLWQGALFTAGAVTALYGAVHALHQSDLKRLLAHTTLMALGTLTMLLGSGSTEAATAAMTFLLVHALYKSAMFLVVGNIDHACHTRELDQLRGLGPVMPFTALGAAAAALSMAGFPLFFGFIGKEIMYKGALVMEFSPAIAAAIMVSANMMMTAASGIFFLRPFLGPLVLRPTAPHETGPGNWLGPLVLGSVGILFGIIPWWVAKWLVSPAVMALHPTAAPVELVLYHGINLPLLLSIVTLSGGTALYIFRNAVRQVLCDLECRLPFRFDRLYAAAIDGLQAVAETVTGLIQAGAMHRHLAITLAVALAAMAAGFLRHTPALPSIAMPRLSWQEWAVMAMVVTGVVTVVFARSRLTAVCALGVSGAGVALLFVLGGAPDLALTQLMVETLTVIIISIVLLRLPALAEPPPTWLGIRWGDAALSAAVGVFFSAIIIGVTQGDLDRQITRFYELSSVAVAHGHNIVNVILVDFRGLDTMGEITVVALAGIAASALITQAEDAPPNRSTVATLILKTTTRLMVGLILVFSIFLLFRGHHEPGGGFAGALVAATGFALFAISEGPAAVRRALRVDPRALTFVGLAVALGSGLLAMAAGKTFMTGLWLHAPTASLGTPMLFDTGVYITVVGAVLTLVMSLEERIT